MPPHRLLCLIAEFDRPEGWTGAGIRSCAHWLQWQCGISLGPAREKVRVVRKLESLSRITAAAGVVALPWFGWKASNEVKEFSQRIRCADAQGTREYVARFRYPV